MAPLLLVVLAGACSVLNSGLRNSLHTRAPAEPSGLKASPVACRQPRLCAALAFACSHSARGGGLAKPHRLETWRYRPPSPRRLRACMQGAASVHGQGTRARGLQALPSNQTITQVRLANKTGNAGRLEVLIDGVWGTVRRRAAMRHAGSRVGQLAR